MNIDIECAQMADLAAIVELKIAMFAENNHSHWLHEDIRLIARSDYERLYDLNRATHFVVRAGGRIVAMAGAFIKSDLPYRYFRCDLYGFIGDVYTQPAYRHRGLSTSLVKCALDWFVERELTTVRLLASGSGRPIYEEMGFKATNEMVLTLAERKNRSRP